MQGLRALGVFNEVVLLLVAMTFAIGYFLVNTLLITVIPHLKRNEPMRLNALMGSFGWVGITYAASSLIAGLLFLPSSRWAWRADRRGADHRDAAGRCCTCYFRKREFDDAAHRVRLEAAEREAEQTARHLAELRASASSASTARSPTRRSAWRWCR